MGERELLEDALENYNYPSEMGEPVHDSVEELARILGALDSNSEIGRIVAWLKDELAKGYLYGETNDPSALPIFTHVRVKSQDPVVLEGSRNDGKSWETVAMDLFD